MRKVAVLLFLIMFVIGTDVFMVSPLIPKLQQLFNIPTAESGWLVSAYALGYMVVALIAGPLSDGWNRKKVMFFGVTCFALTTFIGGFASSFWSMLTFRLLAGISASFIAPQVWAAIPILFPGPKTAKALGIAFTGIAAAQVLGVPIGSLLAASNWSYSFFAIGGFSFILAIAVLLLLPEMRPNSERGAVNFVWKRYLPLISSARARGAYLAYFLFQMAYFSSLSFFGKWLTESFHVSINQVGIIMVFLGIGTLTGSLCSAAVNHKLSHLHVLLTGCSLLSGLFLVLPHLSSIVAVCAGYFAISVIFYIVAPPIMGLLVSLDPAIRGTITSLSQSAMYAATMLGSWVAGVLYARFNGLAAVGVLSAVCFAASVFTFLASGILRREDPIQVLKKAPLEEHLERQ